MPVVDPRAHRPLFYTTFKFVTISFNAYSLNSLTLDKGIVMKQRTLGTICALAIALTCALAGSPSSADPYYELHDSYQITSPTEIGHTVSMIDPTGQTITKDKCTSEPGDYTQAYFRVQGTNSICDLVQVISDDAVSERLKIDGAEFTFTSMTAVLIDKTFEGMSFKEVSVTFPKGWVAKTADFDGKIDEKQTTVTWTHITRNVTVKGTTKAGASATSEAAPSSSSSPSSTVSSSSYNNWIFLAVAVLIIIGGGTAIFLVLRGQKKPHLEAMPAPGTYPDPFAQQPMPQPGQYPLDAQYFPPQGQVSPQQWQAAPPPQPEQFNPQQQQWQPPEQGQQPGQYPQG